MCFSSRLGPSPLFERCRKERKVTRWELERRVASVARDANLTTISSASQFGVFRVFKVSATYPSVGSTPQRVHRNARTAQ
jgi:hypothetical protein